MTTYTPNFGLALPDFRQGPWHDQLNNDITKIDALLFSALSGANVAVWANNEVYGEGETVVDDSDASIWLCAVAHTSSPSPTTFAEDRLAEPTFWTRLLTGFAPRGEWTNATNYFPYDLVYDPNLGVMALCSVKHTSNAAGNITDDEIYWAFLIDMSNADLSTAVAVTYSNTSSGLTGTNVQSAIDELETQIHSLNNVNITQGNQITALQTKDTTHETRMTAIETKNTTQDTKNTDQDATLTSLQTQITALQTQVNAIPLSVFPAGTKMVFIQPAPPTGWVISGAYNDRAIRIVSGSSGGNAAGSFGFSSIFAAASTGGHAVSIAEMPSHGHPAGSHFTLDPTYSADYVTTMGGGDVGSIYLYPVIVGAAGSGAAHTHPMELRVAYVDACVGVKS